MVFIILETAYKRNHAILSFCDWLLPLSTMSSRLIHVVTYDIRLSPISFFFFFSGGNNIPLHVYSTFSMNFWDRIVLNGIYILQEKYKLFGEHREVPISQEFIGVALTPTHYPTLGAPALSDQPFVVLLTLSPTGSWALFIVIIFRRHLQMFVEMTGWISGWLDLTW